MLKDIFGGGNKYLNRDRRCVYALRVDLALFFLICSNLYPSMEK